jgi:hypothetical protein
MFSAVRPCDIAKREMARDLELIWPDRHLVGAEHGQTTEGDVVELVLEFG